VEREDKVGLHLPKLGIGKDGGSAGPVFFGWLKQECRAASSWTLPPQALRYGHQNCNVAIVTAEVGRSRHQRPMLEF
jgi:hypothetical protein